MTATPSTAELWDTAFRHYRQGDLRNAHRLCREITSRDPGHVPSWFYLGVIGFRTGRLQHGAQALQTAIKLQPDYAEAHSNLGNCLAGMGQFDEAMDCFQEALRLSPEYPEAHNNLGNVLRDTGRLTEAIERYEEALRLRPRYADAHNNCGIAHARRGDLEAAARCYETALDCKHDFALALNNLGTVRARQKRLDEAIGLFERALRVRPDYADAHGNLGMALQESGRYTAAESAFRQATQLQPSRPQGHLGLGQALAEMGKLDEAIASFERAIECDPRSVDAYNNLGNALRQRGRMLAAERALRKALEIAPEHAVAHGNLAIVLAKQQRFSEATFHYDRAISLEPKGAGFYMNRALTELVMGDFERGWKDYEWRWKCDSFQPRGFVPPRWNGEPLDGKRILVHYEQGFGDTLQFVRYTRFVKQRGGHVILWVPSRLVPIMESCPFVDETAVEGGELPDFDFHIELLSLPFLLGTTLGSIPAEVPYLQPPPDLVEQWAGRLPTDSFRVGIAWQGNPSYSGDPQRSIPLAQFATLAAVPNVRLISLQRGFGVEQLEQARFSVTDLGPHVDETCGAFGDTAAIMAHLDLVVTSDSAIAHLAGALGKPVWVALPAAADWRWLLERDDSPWYPSMRLFRQDQAGDWTSVFQRLAAELMQAANASGTEESRGGLTAEGQNQRGVEYARKGQLDAAIVCFRHALAADPDYPDAYSNLGNALRSQGRADDAIEALRKAIRLRPDYPEAHHNLGLALTRKGQFKEAVNCCRRALELAPQYAPAHNSLGFALTRQGRRAEAVASFRQALHIDPDLAPARNNLGNALADDGQLEEAVEQFRHAVRVQPIYPEAHNNLGNALRELGRIDQALQCFETALQQRPAFPEAFNNLGITLSRRELHQEAIENYEQALRIWPDYAAAYNNLGISYANLNEAEKAIASYREAIRIKKDYAEAYNNLAIVLTQQGRFEEAKTHYAEALRYRPNYPEAHSNLGIALTESRAIDEAVQEYNKALELRPEYHDARMNRALSLLLVGDFEQGWPDYEARWECKDFRRREFDQPRWEGESLAGKTILLHAEQGFGDTFQFVRYAHLVRQQGARVVLRCPRPLTHLLAHCPFVDELTPDGDPLPPFDVHLELMSLPLRFNTTTEDIPASVPYLFPREDLIEYWERELAYINGFKIGINWQGNPKYRGDRYRSIPLAHFAPLAAQPGARLISLQKGHGTEQLQEVWFSVTSLGARVDDAAGSFMDTAAVMKNLDLVVTSDTATAHLAGGLGVPTWLALPYAPDWRWMLDTAHCPWYPTMRLFRQTQLNDWEPVFSQMAAALADRVRETSAKAVATHVAPGELIDKLTILQIKSQRIQEERKLENVRRELQALAPARERLGDDEQLETLSDELRAVNETLWDIEDEIRKCEAASDFGSRFVELARSVYKTNDVRADLKKQINLLLGSELIEEKAYVDYER